MNKDVSWYQKKFSRAIAVGLCLLGSIFTVSAEPEISHTLQTIDTEFRLTQPILSLNLLGNANKELLIFAIDEQQRSWLSIYGLDSENGLYRQLHRLSLPPEFLAFDITAEDDTLSRPQALYFLSESKLLKLEVTEQKAKFKALLPVTPLLQKSRADFISRSHFVRDFNKDGLDDFIIGGFTQTQLFIQQADGQFMSQWLPITPQVLQYRDGARYIEASRYFADLNLDGREDIIKIAEGELEFYPQQADGLFSTIATFLPVSIAISGLDWWNKRDVYGEALDQSNLTYRKVEQLKDTNNDGLVDMVVRYTKSSGVLDRVNDYEIYLGRKGDKTVSFAKQADNVIRADGTLTGFELRDIDNDKVDEVLVSGFDIGLSQVIGALVSGSIDQDVYLFKQDGQGQFPKKPNVSESVELSFSLTSGQSGSPVVHLADFNGDGYQDLILSDGDDALNLFWGQASGDIFSSKTRGFKLSLPSDGKLVISSDLNADGKADLLMSYGRQDSKTLQRQFIVFLSR
ncbi:VCBS repeat-containing protein [Shewanella sp. Isolate11]|uniref:FG-GAP repeat domain-containing protein n=1 Tax=Shewanella sp. Isolate11 TaxID=2908530 RepID=UPI001EFCE4FE|nr:VCBS repeat-containing protein [Shewanella sp. Isolate11]MCG9698197.1 VCBS repeat-containing protein [Shewanella sp. Isolate11]